MFFTLALNLVLSGLDAVLKNPVSRQKYQDRLLEIAKAILAHYQDSDLMAAGIKVPTQNNNGL